MDEPEHALSWWDGEWWCPCPTDLSRASDTAARQHYDKVIDETAAALVRARQALIEERGRLKG